MADLKESAAPFLQLVCCQSRKRRFIEAVHSGRVWSVVATQHFYLGEKLDRLVRLFCDCRDKGRTLRSVFQVWGPHRYETRNRSSRVHVVSLFRCLLNALPWTERKLSLVLAVFEAFFATKVVVKSDHHFFIIGRILLLSKMAVRIEIKTSAAIVSLLSHVFID